MSNVQQVKKVGAIYMRILEGEGVEENPLREEEYIYLEDEDELFMIDRKNGTLKSGVRK